MNQQATRRESVTGQGAVGDSTRVVLGLTMNNSLEGKGKVQRRGDPDEGSLLYTSRLTILHLISTQPLQSPHCSLSPHCSPRGRPTAMEVVDGDVDEWRLS
jgi:hypothetical protein